MRRKMFAALLGAAVLCMTVPAAAETFTTADGVLSVDLPDNTWKEMTDPAKWFTLSDGANLITFEHYSNGEKLPDMSVADSHYVNVFQAAISTQNEVFIVTGSVVDAQKIPEITEAILSVKILKYNTKMAVRNDAAAGGAAVTSLTVESMNATMYATAGVNVRSGYSTTDAIIGALGVGESVKVTGSVKQNGADYGWYQVSYNGAVGYVSASFLSTTQPAASGSSRSGVSYTGKAKTIYKADGTAITVYQATDDYWYDGSGVKYMQITDYEFSTENGTSYTVNKPQTDGSVYATGSPFTVYWGNGNTATLTMYSDGYYYSDEWVRYYPQSDGTYQGADGTCLYPYEPDLSGGSDSEASTGYHAEHMLSSQDTGATVTVSSEEGDSAYVWIGEDGVNYQNNGDGTFTDYYGNDYDLVW